MTCVIHRVHRSLLWWHSSVTPALLQRDGEGRITQELTGRLSLVVAHTRPLLHHVLSDLRGGIYPQFPLVQTEDKSAIKYLNNAMIALCWCFDQSMATF